MSNPTSRERAELLALFLYGSNDLGPRAAPDEVEAIKLALDEHAAAEREACALVADKFAAAGFGEREGDAANNVAAAIRRRGAP